MWERGLIPQYEGAYHFRIQKENCCKLTFLIRCAPEQTSTIYVKLGAKPCNNYARNEE